MTMKLHPYPFCGLTEKDAVSPGGAAWINIWKRRSTNMEIRGFDTWPSQQSAEAAAIKFMRKPRAMEIWEWIRAIPECEWLSE